jgi:hypothetical protein
MNLSSGTLLTVLVLYLVLHQGAGMQTQQVVSFKEMWEQRSRYQLLGKILEEAVQTFTWRGCANSYIKGCANSIIPSPGSCLVLNNPHQCKCPVSVSPELGDACY